MQALTLTELQSLNRAVEYIRRTERQRLHRNRATASSTSDALDLFNDLHDSGLISLLPDEDEIREQERRNMRENLLASYGSRHPAGETYHGWLVRIANSGLRGEQVAAETLYPDEIRACEECGAIDDPTLSADRRESPHAKYCPVRSHDPEPSAEETERRMDLAREALATLPSAAPEPAPTHRCPGCGATTTYQAQCGNPYREIASGGRCERCGTPTSQFERLTQEAPSLPSMKSVRADAREAGANMLHRVIVTDEATGAETVVSKRRSAHRYGYALCRWTSRDGERTIIVGGWSRSATRRIPGCFPVAVHRID